MSTPAPSGTRQSSSARAAPDAPPPTSAGDRSIPFGDEDWFVAITQVCQQITDQFDTSEVDLFWGRWSVVRLLRSVVMHRPGIEPGSGASGVQLGDVAQIPHPHFGLVTQVAARRKRPGDHHSVGHGSLDARVHCLQQRGIPGRIGGAPPPLECQIWLVPDNNMPHSIGAVALEERCRITGKVGVVRFIEIPVARIAGTRPLRDDVEPGDDLQSLAHCVTHDHIGARPVVPETGARLDIRPGKQIDDPARPHFTHLFQRSPDVPLVTDTGEAGMDADLRVDRDDLLLRGEVERPRCAQCPELGCRSADHQRCADQQPAMTLPGGAVDVAALPAHEVMLLLMFICHKPAFLTLRKWTL
jgi:hypothetical protein